MPEICPTGWRQSETLRGNTIFRIIIRSRRFRNFDAAIMVSHDQNAGCLIMNLRYEGFKMQRKICRYIKLKQRGKPEIMKLPRLPTSLMEIGQRKRIFAYSGVNYSLQWAP